MPFVPPSDTANQAFADLEALVAEHGSPPWRVALVGTPSLRVVLLCWPPGYQTVPHLHPYAEEVFQVVQGRALFAIGSEPEREIGPGEFVLAERNVRHAIRVPEGEPLVLFAAVAPNEDRPDETIEPA